MRYSLEQHRSYRAKGHTVKILVKSVAYAFALTIAGAVTVDAKTLRVTIDKIDEKGVGAAIGTIELEDTNEGLRIVPDLKGLPPGPHGFHIHANESCGPTEQNGKLTAGMAAGGHFDPLNSGKHRGPLSTEGHKGDLPVLVVDSQGEAHTPMLAPHLKVDDLAGHSIMVHAGGDNYADEPTPLGGGGARIACGTI
jgi:superoxide dismutase, Cu-Zn family